MVTMNISLNGKALEVLTTHLMVLGQVRAAAVLAKDAVEELGMEADGLAAEFEKLLTAITNKADEAAESVGSVG